MKKTLILLTMTAMLFGMNSCKEECEKNNTGELTIENKVTDVSMWFKYRMKGEQNYSTPFTLATDESKLFTVPAGTYNISFSPDGKEDSYYTQTSVEIKVPRCGSQTYSTPAKRACEWIGLTHIKIVNNVGFSTKFDVSVADDYFLGEVTIAHGSSYTYQNIDLEGNRVRFWVHNGEAWFYTPTTYSLPYCEYTFTWNAKKDMEIDWVQGDKDAFSGICNP